MSRETIAAVFTAPGQCEVRRVPVPAPGPTEVVVRTEASIISNGTERWVWSGRFHSPGQPSRAGFPWVPGYQRVGIIEELGAEVTGLEVGQRVAATISRFEGEYAGSWGSHAALGVTEASQCFPVPEGVAVEDVAGLVLTQVGYNGGTRPPVAEGDVAIVIGDGLVGQWAAQTFRSRGAYVVICGRRPRRVQIAAEVSADEVVDTRSRDICQIVAERWPGGVKIVDEAVGLLGNVELAISLLAHDGHLVLNGYHPEGEHLMNIQWLHDKEITCHGMSGWTTPRMEKTLAAVAEGKLKVRELVTHEFAGAEANRAYKMVWEKEQEMLGVLLRWS